VWGKPDAKVTLTIFQDLACGQCKRVHREAFPELTKSFVDTGKLKIEFYEFPLLMGEDVARHYGVLCAAQQGKYTHFLDKVYENFKVYKVKEQASYAKTVKGLDLAKWNQCMSGTDALASIVKAHKEVGTSVGVDGTPTLFLNGESTTNFREELLANVAKLAQ
jgi:protein-disulfide isomerase